MILAACSVAACADEPRTTLLSGLQCRLDFSPVALPAALSEASGAAVSPRNPSLVWIHNDSGGEAELFGVLHDGSQVARVRITGVENDDWEDIAVGPCPEAETCLYIADIGDNRGNRPHVTVHRLPEPPTTVSEWASVQSTRLRYPEGPRDAEALFLLPDGSLYIVTKGENSEIALYRAPAPLRGSEVLLERVRSLTSGPVPLQDRVTAADASPSGEWVALRTRSTLLLYRTADLLSGEGEPYSAPLTMLQEPQGEGVAFGGDGRIVLTSEGGEEPLPGRMAVLRCSVDSGPVIADASLRGPDLRPVAETFRHVLGVGSGPF